jgi:hypothetical protein
MGLNLIRWWNIRKVKGHVLEVGKAIHICRTPSNFIAFIVFFFSKVVVQDETLAITMLVN